MDFIRTELERIKAEGLHRSLLEVEGAQGRVVRVKGRELVCFSSNNYLGLADRPELRDAAIEAVEKYGVGAGASRLVSGTMSAHLALEREIASFKGEEDAIVFPTGYMANVGTICALVGKGDLILCDRLNHASIIDACRLSGARLRTYRHRDLSDLERLLRTRQTDGGQGGGKYRRTLIVTDTVFSVDGDIAPLADIVRLAHDHDAVMMVDDAHGTGVFGRNGRGVLEALDLEDSVDVKMGTLSKAVGCIGGFVTGGSELVDYLRNRARSFIYTTALPPACCAAAQAGIRLISAEPDLREKLWENVRALKEGLKTLGCDTGDSESQIIPIILGPADRTVEVARRLRESGFLAGAMRPPTVPAGKSRLRICVMATHTAADIEGLLNALESAMED